MSVLVTPNFKRIVVDALTPHFAPDVTVGASLPADWTTASKAFVQVAWDGTFRELDVMARAAVRIVAWTSSSTASENLAAKAEGLLLAGVAGRAIEGQSVAPAVDDATKAPIASVLVYVDRRLIQA